MAPMRTDSSAMPSCRSSSARSSRRSLRIAGAIVAAVAAGGCGGGEEAPPAGTVSDAPRERTREGDPIAMPGAEIGLATDGGAASAASAVGVDRSGGGDASPSAAAPPRSSSSSASSRPAPSLPAPPQETVEQVYGESASSLSRESQDGRFGDFREMMARNSAMMVEVAKSRAAMRRGDAGADAEYLELNASYAKFSDAIAAYMAQPRWNARDREVMGYLYSRSNEEAVRRLQGGS